MVATLTLNRPERLNAAPPLMFDEFRAALQQLPALGAGALLITGEGRTFCSGADLQTRVAAVNKGDIEAACARVPAMGRALPAIHSLSAQVTRHRRC